jgi:hypothetical protein
MPVRLLLLLLLLSARAIVGATAERSDLQLKPVVT